MVLPPPRRPVPVDPEHVQARPVERRGPGVDIGGDPLLTSGADLAAAPDASGEMSDFALHLGTDAGIGLLPFGGALIGLVPLEDLFVGMDADSPPRPVGGASGASGQLVQAGPKLASPPPRAAQRMGATTPAGQVTVAASSPTAKSSLPNRSSRP